MRLDTKWNTVTDIRFNKNGIAKNCTTKRMKTHNNKIG